MCSVSPRHPEEKRPFVELHVLYVPNDQWNVKLNKVPVEAIQSFVSGGFIRVYPDVTLKSLRSTLAALLGGSQGATDKFFFLKCVGHSLALVKSKQEPDVKVKTFAPPYVMDSSPVLSQSLLCTHNESAASDKDAESPSFGTNKQELIEEIKMMRQERRQLEWMRQDLLRKGKDLLAQNRHRRNQARDSWKKKYFETKKATAPLEESLRNVRQELETFYSKLLHQLHARKDRSHPKKQGRASGKNELVIQIMTECYEIDDLQRKVEDAKMKLLTEIKLRKQASTELRALKAELAQKKSQSSHPRTMRSYPGNMPQDRAHMQS
uniref:Spermatogenesis associated 1 n=1 Tax=Neogobius melanostomus TaxID=47308 RepID=A0A8C6TYH6_9GOBI